MSLCRKRLPCIFQMPGPGLCAKDSVVDRRMWPPVLWSVVLWQAGHTGEQKADGVPGRWRVTQEGLQGRKKQGLQVDALGMTRSIPGVGNVNMRPAGKLSVGGRTEGVCTWRGGQRGGGGRGDEC